MRAKRVALGHALCMLSLITAGPAGQAAPVVIRFLDSATGCAVQPEVTVQPQQAGVAEQRLAPAQVGLSGHAALALERGRHMLTAVAPRYRPMSGALEVRDNPSSQIQVLLDPVELPPELQRDNITARERDGATLFQGFIVDEDSSEPLEGVHVSSWAGGVETVSDARGFYQISVPVPAEAAEEGATANLAFEKPGYRAEERERLEVWSRGAWNYNVRLQRGGGRQVVDEGASRRQMPPDQPATSGPLATAANAASAQSAAPGSSLGTPGAPAVEPLDGFKLPTPNDATNATIRVPRNIRVEKDGVIYYVTMDFYAKHVLPHEWLASWNRICLYAGSVAVRSYAVARINGRAPDSDHDICGTSSCQVFKPNSSAPKTDDAVEFTDGCVLLNVNGNVASTEYSAENNSLGKDCGDGFTAPTGGCLYDPICAGHDRSGHGRGMCQRGSERWGRGANGFPARDWIWIVDHYYPNLQLVRGAPLLIGDNVRAETTLDVRACSGGGIEGGATCPLITTKATGKTGVIIGGPLVITNDSKGFTWYQIRWDDAGPTTGWSCENFLERVFSAPTAPAGLTAAALATDQIHLTWTDTSSGEAGFSIERAPGASGPWLELGTVEANVTTFTDANLYPGSTWYYRVLAYNAAGPSPYTPVTSATTPADVPPTLSPIYDEEVTPGMLITFTNSASAPERVQLITDFEPFLSETANGVVLFRTPNLSASTSIFLDGAPEMDLAAVTDTYPSNGHGTGQVLYVHCNFTNANNPWLRLTTSNTVAFPNPVIDFTHKLRFDLYADQPVRVAVGCRETTTPAGTAIGSDGGTTGSSLEWAGVTNTAGTAPMPTRTVTSSTWTTLTFDFPNEPIRSFSGGNGALSTASGLGVLEHLAIVPAGGTGIYNLYLDNFAVLRPRTFTFSLGAGAPTNASLNPATGVFAWTPSQAQSPSTNQISIVVTDDSSPPLRATNTFTVVVKDFVPNSPPLLAPIANRTVYARSTLTLIASAFDLNPNDILAFSLDPGAPASASIDQVTGVFTWTTTDADTNSVHPITVRVTDNGTPPLSATASFSVTVITPPPPNQAPMLAPIANRTIAAGSTLTFTEQAQDPDNNDLTFSLGSGAPAGATIGPASGVFSWMPPDALSNTTQHIIVRVTDDGVPPLSGSAGFDVTVLPRLPNQPPMLLPVAARTVHAGSLVVFTNAASDLDAADTLSFSLDDDAPAGANIDTVSGIFTWTPTDAYSDTTNSIVVWVTDDGEPPLSASTTAVIIVRGRPVLQVVSISGTAVTLAWSAIAGEAYQVEYKDALDDPSWEPLGVEVQATGPQATAYDSGFSGQARRFYRVVVPGG